MASAVGESFCWLIYIIKKGINLVVSSKRYIFAKETIKHLKMTAIIERTPRSITVRMSTRRWNKILELENTYKLARIINRSMKQVESEPSMTPEEAMDVLKAL
ncbi:MAG: hypothetical protein IJ633_00035 [Prevotella sp.]|nr:hypothetical protein [Prevotella sp.]